ncbi:MAG: ParB/RepB/Spo0J family partition protein [Planctomycetaceae bacterium]
MDEHAQHSNSQPLQQRRRLGRGLNALLGGQDASEPTVNSSSPKSESEIAIEHIEPNPFQPRKEFEKEALEELAGSIRQHGILQPLLVRPGDGKFQLIAGERRWRAAQEAGLKSVPCRIMELDDQHIYEVAIEENLKRKDLGVIEKAEAFREYIDRFGVTIEQLAKRLSMSRPAVNNFLRLLELPEAIKDSLRKGTITNGHARAVLSLEENDQLALIKRVERENLSVRKTEQAVKEILKARHEEQSGADHIVPFSADILPADEHEGVRRAKEPQKEEAARLSPHLQSLQDQLRGILGSKVEIHVRGKDAGKIVIPFNSNDDFERLLRQLRRAA